MTNEAKQHDIAKLAQAVQGATAAHAEAARLANVHSSRATDALNALNQCQKDFDAAVEAMRSAGHRDSGWASARRKMGNLA